MNKKGSVIAVLVVIIVIGFIGGYAIFKTYSAAVKQGLNSLGMTIVEIGEYYYYNEMLDDHSFEETTIDLGTTKLYRGNEIEYGTMTINKQGKIKFYAKSRGYCITKNFDNTKIIINKNEDCSI